MPHRRYPSALALLLIPAALAGASILVSSREPGPEARQLAAATSTSRAPASSVTAAGRNGPAASLEGVFENLYD